MVLAIRRSGDSLHWDFVWGSRPTDQVVTPPRSGALFTVACSIALQRRPLPDRPARRAVGLGGEHPRGCRELLVPGDAAAESRSSAPTGGIRAASRHRTEGQPSWGRD